jgi:uncharacterized membrane protein YvbJ
MEDNILIKDSPVKRSKFNKRTILYGACFVASVVFIGVIIWAFATFLNKPALDENFFVSNDNKSTISLTPEQSDPNTNKSHVQTYIVYDFDGDNVSGLKTYFEYTDEEAAAIAFEENKDQPEFKNSELDGKFIVVTAEEDQYKGLTASDVRQQEAALERLQKSQQTTETTTTEEPATEE